MAHLNALMALKKSNVTETVPLLVPPNAPSDDRHIPSYAVTCWIIIALQHPTTPLITPSIYHKRPHLPFHYLYPAKLPITPFPPSPSFELGKPQGANGLLSKRRCLAYKLHLGKQPCNHARKDHYGPIRESVSCPRRLCQSTS